MINLKHFLFFSALTLAMSGYANSEEATSTVEAAAATEEAAPADCYLPAGPIIPDGNVASEDELVSAQKAMKMFQGSLIEYRNCLSAKQDAIDVEAEGGREKADALLGEFNKSVDAEENMAKEFNEAVRAFKERQQ